MIAVMMRRTMMMYYSISSGLFSYNDWVIRIVVAFDSRKQGHNLYEYYDRKVLS